jgi:hypothetical protein
VRRLGGGVGFPSPGTYTLTASDGTLSATSAPIQVLGPGQVAVIDDANRQAVVGRPYVYNSFGTVTAVSTAGTPAFSTFNVPLDFTVDAQTGAVHWVPVGEGTYNVCVQASAGAAEGELRYQVNVTAAIPGPPDAGFVVRWSPVAAGGFVVDDPVGTQSRVGPPIFRWRFGDGSWPGTDPRPFHRFVLPGGYRTHLTVRDSAGQRAVADQPVQVGLARLAPTVRITSAQPLEGDNAVAATLSAPRFTGMLLGVFAALALALSAIGIYGVLSYVVSRRTREIGIRVAIGAGRAQVMRLVLGTGLGLSLAGVAAGLALAAWASRVMTTLLHEVRPGDPATFAAVAVVLTAVALAASLIPAWRAARRPCRAGAR